MNTYRLVERPQPKSTWQKLAECLIATYLPDGSQSLILMLSVIIMLTVLVLTGHMSTDSPVVLISVILILIGSSYGAAYRAGQESQAKTEQPEPTLSNEQWYEIARDIATRHAAEASDTTQPMPKPVPSNGHKQ